MVREVSYDRLQREQIQKGVYKTAPQQKVEDFLGLSQQYVKGFYEKYFPGFSEVSKSSYDAPLTEVVEDIFSKAKINPKKDALPLELSYITRHDFGFLDMDPNRIIDTLSKKHFSKSQIAKVVMAQVFRRIDKIAEFADSTNITLSDVDDFEDLPPANKFNTIFSEITSQGFYNIDGYYKTAVEIIGTNNDILLQKRQEFVKRFRKTPVISDKVDRDIARQFFGIQSKEYNYALKRSEEFKFAFEEGLKYLRACKESGTQPTAFTVAAENIARTWKNIRDNIPWLVNSHINAYTFWGTQLGRNPTDEDLKNLGISRRQFKSMTNHVFDERLRHSEASSFSISHIDESIDGYRGFPERLLLDTVRALIQTNHTILKENGQTSLMVIINDRNYIKIQLPPDATDEAILWELNQSPSGINLNPLEKYNLRLDAFKNPKNRSKRFKEIYGFKGTESGYGDFIVRLTTKGSKDNSKDNKGVTSMYTVGPYKGLVDINLAAPKGLEFSIAASHHNFDGVALSTVYDEIQYQLATRQNDTIMVDEMKIIEKSKKHELELGKDSLPIPEATVSTTIDTQYKTIAIRSGKKSQEVKSNVIRALDLALANNVPSMHILYNAKGNNPYSDPRFDNVQPVVISVEPIKAIITKFEFDYKAHLKTGAPMPTITPTDKKKIMEYVEMVNNAITWGKRGFSTPGVLASPFGAMRNLASKITTSIYENVKLLNQSNGMFSPMPGSYKFKTAESDVYTPTIDVGRAKKHLGVIGSEAQIIPGVKPSVEEKATYTVTKSPNQAQTAFRETFATNPLLRLDSKRQERVIKVLNEVLTGWEKLVFHDVGFKYGNPLKSLFFEDYNSLLKRTFNTLKKKQYLGEVNLERLGIGNFNELQAKLNQVLIDDAKSIIDPNKIDEAHQMLVAFFEAVNRPTGKTGPLPHLNQ
ncbi:hypothetical protein HZA76_00800 [Candidatus Roizmanbacteria bacterium]|nr:hypothetical protein [Candidatus Roizmanbacteria bacterium]